MGADSLSLFKKGKRYYIQFTDVDGRRRQKSTYCTRQTDAIRILTEFEKLLRIRERTKHLSAFIEELLPFLEGNLSRGSVRIYWSTLRLFIRTAGDLPLTSYNAQHADQYKTERLKHVRPVTVNIELRTLRAAFNIACRWNLLVANPFRGVKLVPIPQAQPAFFTRVDFQVLLQTIADPLFREIVLFAAVTGLRRGELVNLKWDQVDLSRKMILVVSSSTFRTKAGRSRNIPLSDIGHAVLTSRAERPTGEYVFSRDGRPLYAAGLSRMLKKYVRMLGLDERLHFHSLRHSFASWLAQANVSIYTLKELLGHSDVKTTQVYAHLQAGEMHEVVNKIDVGKN